MAELIENEKVETMHPTLVDLRVEIQRGIDSANKGELFEIDEVFDAFLLETTA